MHTRYAPVRHSSASSKLDLLPFDLHVLSLPLAFILSQDQTLRCIKFKFNNQIEIPWISCWLFLTIFSSFPKNLFPFFQREREDNTFFLRKKSLIKNNLTRLLKNRQRHTLPGITLVPSALLGLTSLFEMGRGEPQCYSHRKIFNILNPE